MAKRFTDGAFVPIPTRRTGRRVTRAPKIGPRTLRQAIKKKVGGLGAKRRPVSPATFIARSRAVSSEQKAIWHQVTGAGRGRVKRKFFDLNASDQTAIRDGLEKLVAARVKRV